MDFKFRWMDPLLGRFISPDDIVPNPYNPQSWNRYSYAMNSPILYNDPTGHDPIGEFLLGMGNEAVSNLYWFAPPIQEKFSAKDNESAAMLAGRVVVDIASMFVGSAGMEAGGGLAAASVVCEGVSLLTCTPVSVAGVGAGVIVMGESAGVATRGALGLGENLYLMAKKYRRADYGGSGTTNNPEADKLRNEGEGQPCRKCGNIMRSGTEFAPEPEHEPALFLKHWFGGGMDMTFEEKTAYAKSKEAFNGVLCKTCQRQQGGALSGLSRLLNKIFGAR